MSIGAMAVLRAYNEDPQGFARTAGPIADSLAQRAAADAAGVAGVQPPVSQDAVAKSGQERLDNLERTGKQQVEQARTSNQSWVRSEWGGKDPESTPNAEAVAARYGQLVAQASERMLSRRDDVAVASGAMMAAQALYKSDQSGMLALLRNAYGFGVGYQSPTHIRDMLRHMALDDQNVRRELIAASNGGIDPDSAAGKERLSYLGSRLNEWYRQKANQSARGGNIGALAP